MNSERISFEEELRQAKEQAPLSEEVFVPHGLDLLSAAERDMDLAAVLAGERWLSRKTACLVVAPSGHGKSSFSIQLAIDWAIARTSFGIHPRHPLRILIVQAEDDDNDVTEFCQCAIRMNLSNQEKGLLRKNTHIECVNDKIGASFLKRLRTLLERLGPFDLVIINPLGSYLEKDARDSLSLVNFRTGLAKILEDFNCAAMLVHHTPKTNFMTTEQYEWWDWMYAAAGDAGLVNWVRSCLVIWPTSVTGTYKFIAAKRGQRIGWSEKEFYFSHSIENGVFLWVPSTEAQIKSAQKTDRERAYLATKAKQVEELYALIPVLDPVAQLQVFERVTFNEKRARQIINCLIQENKIFEHCLAHCGRGPHPKGYARTPQP